MLDVTSILPVGREHGRVGLQKVDWKPTAAIMCPTHDMRGNPLTNGPPGVCRGKCRDVSARGGADPESEAKAAAIGHVGDLRLRMMAE